MPYIVDFRLYRAKLKIIRGTGTASATANDANIVWLHERGVRVDRRGVRLRVRRLLGFLKDGATRMRALANGRSGNLQLALISATSHEESHVREEHLKLVISASKGSRMYVSRCICLLMERLHKTRSWVVAMKCLILIHKALRGGNFIFQDQLSFYPANGGRNYLNLARFRDRSSPCAWEASGWVRWYARFVELRIEMCRTIGNFVDFRYSKVVDDTVRGLENTKLVSQILHLHELLEEICRCPLNGDVVDSVLMQDALQLVAMDSLRIQEELRKRFKEACQRLDSLQSSEANKLAQVCDQLAGKLIFLVNLVAVAVAHRFYGCSEKLLLTDYELLNLKKAFNAPVRVTHSSVFMHKFKACH